MRRFAVVAGIWLLTRLLCLMLFDPNAVAGAGDSAYFLEVARSIAAGDGHAVGGIPTAFRAPGYPVFLAPLASGPAWLVFGLQSLATLGAGMFTLRRIPGAIGLVTALLIVSSPYLVAFEWQVLAETLLVCTLWVAWLLLGAPARPVAAGVLLGVAALLRETVMFLPLAAAAGAWWIERGWSRRLLIAAILAFALTVPWQLRNASLPGGSFALSDGRSGFNLWIGTWERDGDWYLRGLDNADYPPEAFRSPGERQSLLAAYRQRDDAAFRAVAIERIVGDPITTLQTWATRYPRMWIGTRSDQMAMRPERESIAWKLAKTGLWGLNLLMLVAGLAGMVLAGRHRRRDLIPFALPILYTAVLYVPFHNAETRYSLPALPFLYLFVAYLALHLASRRRVAWG